MKLRSLQILCIISIVFTLTALAKRIPPKPVAPIVTDGIRYSAGGDGRDQYLVATDIASGKEMWRTKVFHTRIEFWKEEDVQWVFITNLKLVNDSILVRDEKARCYSFNRSTRKVKREPCGEVFGLN